MRSRVECSQKMLFNFMKSEKSAITYNIGQKWAVTLCCEAEERLEGRVAKIMEYLDKNYLLKQWAISDIDATGSYNNCLTARFAELSTVN